MYPDCLVNKKPTFLLKMLALLLLLSRFSCVRLCATHRQQPTRLPVPGILQARTLEWVAISFSNAWKWKVKCKSLSRVWLLATPWTACSLPGSSTHGISQARVLVWVAIAFSAMLALKRIKMGGVWGRPRKKNEKKDSRGIGWNNQGNRKGVSRLKQGSNDYCLPFERDFKVFFITQ